MNLKVVVKVLWVFADYQPRRPEFKKFFNARQNYKRNKAVFYYAVKISPVVK